MMTKSPQLTVSRTLAQTLVTAWRDRALCEPGYIPLPDSPGDVADHNARLKRRAVPRAPTNDELLLREVSALFRLLVRMRRR